MDLNFYQEKFSKITVDLIKSAITYIYEQGHNSFAPMGCSGDDFLLFGSSRNKEISLRLHSGTVKLLVTTTTGRFLFYGGFDNDLFSVDYIAEKYYSIIKDSHTHLDGRKSDITSISEYDKQQMKKSRFVHKF